MLKHHDHFPCPVCGAKFDQEVELKHHSRIRHTQQGVSDAGPSNESLSGKEDEPSARKNKEFTRRHME